MTFADLIENFEFPRTKTNAFIDGLSKLDNVPQILGWRPGPGRAHIAWQLMHLAATEDRHVHVRMKGGEAKEPEYVRRFAGGSVVDDDIPTLEEIRRYLNERRQDMIAHLRSLPEEMLDKKPNAEAQWVYREWIKLLSWHEGHHQGQAHITLNLYKNRTAK